jgi:hypothetical protein
LSSSRHGSVGASRPERLFCFIPRFCVGPVAVNWVLLGWPGGGNLETCDVGLGVHISDSTEHGEFGVTGLILKDLFDDLGLGCIIGCSFLGKSIG